MTPVVKALFFDVFGTLVDWRARSRARRGGAANRAAMRSTGSAFADAWRGEYQGAMEEVRAGRIPFSKLDVLHRRNLDRILPRFDADGSAKKIGAISTLAWHRLDAWPDVAPGLARLKRNYRWRRFRTATLADGRSCAAQWFSLGRDPRRRVQRRLQTEAAVYLDAAEAFDLTPECCLMVAAHSDDLAAAAAAGLRTAHIARPDEKGNGRGEAAPSIGVDFAARDLGDLADKLGA